MKVQVTINTQVKIQSIKALYQISDRRSLKASKDLFEVHTNHLSAKGPFDIQVEMPDHLDFHEVRSLMRTIHPSFDMSSIGSDIPFKKTAKDAILKALVMMKEENVPSNIMAELYYAIDAMEASPMEFGEEIPEKAEKGREFSITELNALEKDIDDLLSQDLDTE